MVGEDDTSMSEMEHSMSPHVTFKRPETVDSYNDADVDDYSTQDDGGESTEPENTGSTMYFGQVEERTDQYQVNAMDVEELRRSQRRYRAGRGGRLGQGSDEEDEEDDLGSSTPSAEHSDKNLQSMLCVRSVSTSLSFSLSSSLSLVNIRPGRRHHKRCSIYQQYEPALLPT